MASNDSTNDCSPSTRWIWKRVMVSRAPQARTTARRHAARWRGRARRDPQEWLSLRMKYGGGAEGWVVVDARGVVAPFHGAEAILDVLMEICAQR